MGAVTWVGGSIFFKFVLQPAFRSAGTERTSIRAIGHEFGSIVRIAIVILVVTGAFMAVVHLTAGGNSRVYIGILALKISLAFYMFLIVWLRRRSASAGPARGSEHLWPRLRRAVTSTTALLILGVVVIGLADVLSAVGGHGDGGHDHGGQAKAETAVDEVHDGGVSDDHHKGEEAGAGEVEVMDTAEPTEEAEEEGDGDHHGDDLEEDSGDDDGNQHGDDDEEGDEGEDDHGDGHGHSH